MQLKLVTNAVTSAQQERGQSTLPTAGTTPQPNKPPDHMYEVSILPDGLKIMARVDDTVLRALARAGLKYRVGCKRGGCGICKVHLLLGEVRYERPIAESVLSDDERIQGICLSCRAVPITNIAIQLQEGDRLRKMLGFAYPDPTPPYGESAANPVTKAKTAGTKERKS